MYKNESQMIEDGSSLWTISNSFDLNTFRTGFERVNSNINTYLRKYK